MIHIGKSVETSIIFATTAGVYLTDTLTFAVLETAVITKACKTTFLSVGIFCWYRKIHVFEKSDHGSISNWFLKYLLA